MSNDSSWSPITVIITLTITIFCMGMGSCVDDAVAFRALAAQGFTEPRIRDRSNWFSWLNGCDGTDSVAWQVDAKRDGKPVRVVVCSGALLKGATVRTPQ